MLTSPRSHARAPHERYFALIIKMSISNWSPINSLHDLRLHFWKPWPNRREYRASSPLLSSKGVDEKISRRHAMWPQEPKLSPIKAASIPNDCPKRILQNSYSHLLFTTSFWVINRASRSKFNADVSREKLTFEIRGICPRAQMFIYRRDEHVKLKPYSNPSSWTRALEILLLISSIKSGLQPHISFN